MYDEVHMKLITLEKLNKREEKNLKNKKEKERIIDMIRKTKSVWKELNLQSQQTRQNSTIILIINKKYKTIQYFYVSYRKNGSIFSMASWYADFLCTW